MFENQQSKFLEIFPKEQQKNKIEYLLGYQEELQNLNSRQQLYPLKYNRNKFTKRNIKQGNLFVK